MTKNTLIESIPIKMLDLSRQRVLDVRDVHLEIHYDHLIYNLKFLASETEENIEIWEDIDNDFEFIYLKRFVSGIEKQKHDKERVWKIIISVNGVAKDLVLFFKSKSECEPIYKKLSDWLINTVGE